MPTPALRLAIVIGCALLGGSPVAGAQEPQAAAVRAWVVAPSDGASWASAYVAIHNPTMYDVYILSAQAAGTATSVELRSPAAAGQEAAVVKEFAVPAYGSLDAGPGAPHLRLVGLTRPLKPGDSVDLTLKTDLSTELAVRAEVRGS